MAEARHAPRGVEHQERARPRPPAPPAARRRAASGRPGPKAPGADQRAQHRIERTLGAPVPGQDRGQEAEPLRSERHLAPAGGVQPAPGRVGAPGGAGGLDALRFANRRLGGRAQRWLGRALDLEAELGAHGVDRTLQVRRRNVGRGEGRNPEQDEGGRAPAIGAQPAPVATRVSRPSSSVPAHRAFKEENENQSQYQNVGPGAALETGARCSGLGRELAPEDRSAVSPLDRGGLQEGRLWGTSPSLQDRGDGMPRNGNPAEKVPGSNCRGLPDSAPWGRPLRSEGTTVSGVFRDGRVSTKRNDSVGEAPQRPPSWRPPPLLAESALGRLSGTPLSTAVQDAGSLHPARGLRAVSRTRRHLRSAGDCLTARRAPPRGCPAPRHPPSPASAPRPRPRAARSGRTTGPPAPCPA